ncbi:MAG: TetR family transcriptional regulator C-terminal domain-containing protein [Acidobacteria bacterium]|nr:TetR family transcriptional regulator C-terminal domain-containing protein [Acidobacteriota bacterium]
MISAQRRSSTNSSSEGRTLLIEAAATIIERDGVQAATSRAITAQAGQNLGAITYYFGSKSALLVETQAHVARRIIEPVLVTLRSDRLPAERLLRAVQQLVGLLDDNSEQLAGYVQAVAYAAHDPQTGDSIKTLYHDLRELLVADMESQQAASLLPPWVVPEAMASLIIALVNGVAVGAAIDPDNTDAAAIGAQFTRLLLP